MVWRFKDQTMSFNLGDDFVFNKTLAKALVGISLPFVPFLSTFFYGDGFAFPGVEGIGTGRLSAQSVRASPRPFTFHSALSSFLFISNLFFFCDARTEMSLRDALKVPNFNVLDFDFDEQTEGEVPFLKQVASATQEIRPPRDPSAPEPSATDATSSVPKPVEVTVGSSGSQVKNRSILDDMDSNPEVRSLDEALQYQPSASLKSKGAASDVELKGLVRKRKGEAIQIRSSDPLPMPILKKNKKGSSHSSGDVMIELDEHLSGGKSSREEAARARSAPTPAFSSGFLPVNEVESMEVENL
ncbi:hypothetical protein Hdeb2414_s0006g00210871 [Helianthus debilis subsp. tardiflorus]